MYNLCQNHFATKAHQKQSYLHPGPSFADLIGARIIRRSHKPKPASLGLLQTPVQLLAAFPSPSLRAPQRRGGIEKAAPSGKAKPKPPYRAQAPPKISPSPDGQVRPKSGRPTGAVDPPPLQSGLSSRARFTNAPAQVRRNFVLNLFFHNFHNKSPGKNHTHLACIQVP